MVDKLKFQGGFHIVREFRRLTDLQFKLTPQYVCKPSQQRLLAESSSCGATECVGDD